MSKYTVELRRLCEVFGREEVENWFKNWELSDYLTPEEISVIESRGTFNKDTLAKMIVDSYYMREIGYETSALFKHYAKLTMREIMGEYAQLIYSASIKFDPLVNEDYTESFNRNADNQGQSNSTSTGSGFGVQSDTPQNRMNKQDLLNGVYGTNAEATEQEGSGTTNASNQESETYTRKLKGNRGISSNVPYLIEQYRNYIINLYGDIIERCSILFMGIY